ncbi:MAG: hypothetical protein AAGA21_04535 [Pseudomonadota bacterium]
MSGSPNRRFPRTARAMPEARPKIEREKIRHRRPNDLMFDDGQAPVSREQHLTDDFDQEAFREQPDYQDEIRFDDPGQQYDDTSEDWTIEEGETEEAVAWDHEPEDDWVLDRDDGEPQAGSVEDAYEEETGVVWEDDAYSAEPGNDHPDEVMFGSQSQDYGFAPEVELAGRRDVRPKAPRPPQPHRTSGSGQPQRRQRQTETRQPQARWEGSEAPRPGSRQTGFQARKRPVAAAEPEDGRFSRTRATLGAPAAALAGGLDDEVLERPRSDVPQRRRQAQSAPRPAPQPSRGGRRSGRRPGKAGGKGLIAAVALVLLLGVGWFGYQSAGPGGVQSVLDRLSTIIPLPGSSRTAADTSFGDRQTPETGAASAEQALSDLEERVRQQNAGGPVLSPPREDGPPIPQFKPLPGATRSLSAPASDSAGDEAQLAANEGVASDEEQTNGLSIFKQLWQYLSPG